MKKYSYIIKVFILLFFIGCGKSSDTVISYNSPPYISDEEELTYKFTYSDGKITENTIVSEGNQTVTSYLSTGEEHTFNLNEIYPKNIKLSKEDYFLFHYVKFYPLENSFQGLNWTYKCTDSDVNITVISAKFVGIEKCIYTNNENTAKYIEYKTIKGRLHIDYYPDGSYYEYSEYPIKDLLKYESINSNGETFTVELIEWNRLI